MKAGLTEIKIGTKIKTTKQWNNIIVTGRITHTFGEFGGTSKGAIAGIRLDEEYHNIFGEIGNLFEGDYQVIGG